MPRMHSDAFDVIPFEDINGNWKKLGKGSFGNVYKGSYLGIDVAIKEVLPSTEYDVSKYFEREWRLMKECRHPNICLFIGLSRAPPPDNRIFIISEFIENGNVRLYIHDSTKPFPWKLRLSFVTDVARALAYLHARKCIHRDLKGENLLVTSNGRIKVTDFGFARIAARDEEESKRLTFCGTDSYMSPEILLGDEFDLPTDIFSLGIIFCEIGARKLADDHHFKRTAPTFGIDPVEVRKLMSPGCPDDFYKLCIDCLNTNPNARPTTRVILDRLRTIEAEVLARPEEKNDMHLGSVRFMTGGKRPHAGPRIPSFGVGLGTEIRSSSSASSTSSDDDESDEELVEAIKNLSSVGLDNSANISSLSREPLLNRNAGTSSEYSTAVIKSSVHHTPSSLSSILTIRPSPDPDVTTDQIFPSTLPDSDPLGTSSLMSIATFDTYHTATTDSCLSVSAFPSVSPSSSTYASASSSVISSAYATEGTNNSIIRSLHAPLVTVHRFTLLKPGTKGQRKNSNNGSMSPSSSNPEHVNNNNTGSWNPLEILFSSALLVEKCDLCHKRLGWKSVLECDDCGLRAHVKCGDFAPSNCGIVQTPTHINDISNALNTISPLSKVRQTAAQASEQIIKRKSHSPTGR